MTSRPRSLAGAFLVPALLVAAACQPATPPPLTAAEEAATADTLLGLLARQDTLTPAAKCLAAVALFTGDEPLVVSYGGIFRTTADLRALCNTPSPAPAEESTKPEEAPSYPTVTRSAVHFLTRNHAYVVREASFPEPADGDSTGGWDHVVTAVFSRTPDGWRQNHYHESKLPHGDPKAE